jgi:hypothetical protein
MFCMHIVLNFGRMEVVILRSGAGIAKLAGAGLCLAGVLTIAFYAVPGMSPVSRHRAFPAHAAASPDSGGHANHSSKAIWIEGTFLMVLSNLSWAISIVWQVSID